MKEKLNLGSGKTYLPDYWNVDIRPNVGADQIADIRTVEFSAESFREILCHDVIGHINPIHGKELLRNCYKWLKPNGALIVHTPNLRFLARILSDANDTSGIYNEALIWMYGTAGEGTTNYSENLLRWSYSEDSLTRLLKEIGFIILEVKNTCNGFGLHVIAVKR